MQSVEQAMSSALMSVDVVIEEKPLSQGRGCAYEAAELLGSTHTPCPALFHGF